MELLFDTRKPKPMVPVDQIVEESVDSDCSDELEIADESKNFETKVLDNFQIPRNITFPREWEMRNAVEPAVIPPKKVTVQETFVIDLNDEDVLMISDDESPAVEVSSDTKNSIPLVPAKESSVEATFMVLDEVAPAPNVPTVAPQIDGDSSVIIKMEQIENALKNEKTTNVKIGSSATVIDLVSPVASEYEDSDDEEDSKIFQQLNIPTDNPVTATEVVYNCNDISYVAKVEMLFNNICYTSPTKSADQAPQNPPEVINIEDEPEVVEISNTLAPADAPLALVQTSPIIVDDEDTKSAPVAQNSSAIIQIEDDSEATKSPIITINDAEENHDNKLSPVACSSQQNPFGIIRIEKVDTMCVIVQDAQPSTSAAAVSLSVEELKKTPKKTVTINVEAFNECFLSEIRTLLRLSGYSRLASNGGISATIPNLAISGFTGNQRDDIRLIEEYFDPIIIAIGSRSALPTHHRFTEFSAFCHLVPSPFFRLLVEEFVRQMGIKSMYTKQFSEYNQKWPLKDQPRHPRHGIWRRHLRKSLHYECYQVVYWNNLIQRNVMKLLWNARNLEKPPVPIFRTLMKLQHRREGIRLRWRVMRESGPLAKRLRRG